MLRLKNSGGSKTDGEHGDIVLLAEGLCGGSDLCGGTAADRAGTFEPEELASRVARFENAIGEESETVLGLKVEDGLGVLCATGDPEWEAGFHGDLGAVPVGGEMAGIGEGEFPVGIYAYTEAGHEAAFLGFQQLLVQGGEESDRRETLLAEGADGADSESSGHGSFEAFAADVADDNEGRAVGLREDLVEVAADLVCGR